MKGEGLGRGEECEGGTEGDRSRSEGGSVLVSRTQGRGEDRLPV